MTSSNGNIFRVTGPLWRESTGHRRIPFRKSSDADPSFYVLFDLCVIMEYKIPITEYDEKECKPSQFYRTLPDLSISIFSYQINNRWFTQHHFIENEFRLSQLLT